jgi:hypothetical protein
MVVDPNDTPTSLVKVQEIIEGKNTVLQQVLNTPFWVLTAERPPLQKGDYVLATKYDDGDPCDQFCVGFYRNPLTQYTKVRHDIVDSDGNLFRGNGFRRAEVITQEEGSALIALFPEISDKPGKSLWWHLGTIRGVPNPYDPCEKLDE